MKERQEKLSTVDVVTLAKGNGIALSSLTTILLFAGKVLYAQ